MHPSLLDISVPFASSYKTFWTSLGIVAAWALILLGPSYYVRRAIGQRRWTKLHRFTAVAWVVGLIHALGEGSDAGSAWFVLMIALTTVPAFLLLILRNFQASPAK
jgi:methionine sulfoxide reductase heme-binding subunit